MIWEELRSPQTPLAAGFGAVGVLFFVAFWGCPQGRTVGRRSPLPPWLGVFSFGGGREAAFGVRALRAARGVRRGHGARRRLGCAPYGRRAGLGAGHGARRRLGCAPCGRRAGLAAGGAKRPRGQQGAHGARAGTKRNIRLAGLRKKIHKSTAVRLNC